MGESRFTPTPGPWQISRHAETLVEAGNRSICSTGGYSQNFDRERVISENIGNARLIAAAPDMLAALKGAEEWLSGWASAEPYLTTIRAAIARATGEAK